MQLAGVRFNLWHKSHHLSTAWYLFWPQDQVVILTHPTQQEIVGKRPWRITPWLSIWIRTNFHEADCVFDSYSVAFLLLQSKWTVSHIYGTPTYHTWRTQKAQLYLSRSLWHPHYFQCPCSDCRVWVYIVSNHWDTSLTFGDDVCDHGIWAVSIEIKFPIGKERKRSCFLSGSWPITAMLWILSGCSPPDSIFKWLIFVESNLQRHLSFSPEQVPAFPEVAPLIIAQNRNPFKIFSFKKQLSVAFFSVCLANNDFRMLKAPAECTPSPLLLLLFKHYFSSLRVIDLGWRFA